MTAGRYDGLGTVAFAKDNEARQKWLRRHKGCDCARDCPPVVLAGSETATGDVD
jgi:hypothetical protein